MKINSSSITTKLYVAAAVFLTAQNTLSMISKPATTGKSILELEVVNETSGDLWAQFGWDIHTTSEACRITPQNKASSPVGLRADTGFSMMQKYKSRQAIEKILRGKICNANGYL